MSNSNSINSPSLFIIEPNNSANRSTENLCQLITSSSKDIWKKLHSCGAILFRDYEIKSPDDFEKVALSLLPTTLATQYPGGAPRKKVTERVWTSTSFSSYMPIPAHTELSYLPIIQPSYIFFYCWKSPDWGGQTPIIDMSSVIKDLPTSLVDKCRQQALVYSMLLTKKPQRFFDIRLFQCPWFRKSKTWSSIFNSDNPDLVEKKCLVNGQQIKWLEALGEDLIVKTKAPAIIQDPITGEEIWAGFSPLFHLWGMAIEALFIALHQRTLRSLFVLVLLSLVTIIQQIFIDFCSFWERIFKQKSKLPFWFPGNRKKLDVCFEDGTSLSMFEIFSIIKAYWKNMTIFDWRDGDILLLDNKYIGHQRLPFRGTQRKICTAFGS